MNEPVFILKGNIVYSKNKDELRILKDHYLISESGLVKGVFEKVPPEYAQVSVSDYGECLIIPGLTDLHVHAPQYTFRAMGMIWSFWNGWRRIRFRRRQNIRIWSMPGVHIVSLLTI